MGGKSSKTTEAEESVKKQSPLLGDLAVKAGKVISLNIPLSDAFLKNLISQGVLEHVEDTESKGGPSVSTTLMKKCVAGDVTAFTRKDLDRLDPRIAPAVEGAILREVILLANDKRNIRVSEQGRAILEGGAGRVLINTLSIDPKSKTFVDVEGRFQIKSNISDLSGGAKTEDNLLVNFARATGTFTLACPAGSSTCTIRDYFDFEHEGQSNRELLVEALEYYRQGNLDGASKSLGAVFCKEDPHEKPTATSIPISIEIPRPKLPPQSP